MNDREALYRAICANPDEDTPRLAFADWLDEEGSKESQARADQIRTHVKLSREEPWSLPWREINERWAKLRMKTIKQAKAGKVQWLSHLAGRILSWDFDRGLVGHVVVYSKRFVKEGNRYFEDDPIRSLKFAVLDARQGTVPATELFACSHLARAAKLHFEVTRVVAPGRQLTDSHLDILGQSPRLPDLRALAIHGTHVYSPTALPHLLRRLTGLTELSVQGNEAFHDGHAEALAQCQELSRIKGLDVSLTAITARGIAAILRSPRLTGLTSLGLALQTPGAETLAEIRRRGEAEELVRSIAASPRLENLTELCLDYRYLDDGELRILLTSSKLPNLRRLSVRANIITADGLRAVADTPVAQQLLYLNLGSFPLSQKKEIIFDMLPHAHIEFI